MKSKAKKNHKKIVTLIIASIFLFVLLGIIILYSFKNNNNSYFARIRVAIKKKVQVIYNYNLFDVDTTNDNVIAGYSRNSQIVGFNGKSNNETFELGNVSNLKFKKGDKYRITINYIGGSYTNDKDCDPKFIFEIKKDGEYYNNRKNGTHYLIETLPLDSTKKIDKVLTINDDTVDGDSINFRIFQNKSNGVNFQRYRIKVMVTKLESKVYTAGSKYTNLPTPQKNGYKFLGWYDSLTSGKKITTTSTVLKKYNHTIYALWEADNMKPRIERITSLAAFVTVYAKPAANGSKIVGYYFSTSDKVPNGKEETWVNIETKKLEIAKMPGKYYTYVKDSNGKISNPTSFTITYEQLFNDGPKSRNHESLKLKSELVDFLKEKGDSIDNYNDFIAMSVKSAGLFTKEAVVTAGMAAPNYLFAKYGVHIPYISRVHCYSQRYNVYFGSNPTWGYQIKLKDITEKYFDEKENKYYYPRKEAETQGIGVYCKGTHGGLDCASFVGWSIHNAGFKAENTAGSYAAEGFSVCNGSKQGCGLEAATNMYKQSDIGDLIYNSAHVMLIVGKFEGGLYVYEGTDPIGMNKYTYSSLYNSQYYDIRHMTKYYSNQKYYACLLDYKNQTVPIPSYWKDKENLFNANCKA
jgi:uncharacterized repeat protein (TIGR02543 family)